MALFWVTPVRVLPMIALMVAVPEPPPELMMVPILLTAVVERRVVPVFVLLIVTLPVVVIPPEIVMPLAIALELVSVKLPMPVMPIDTVSNELPLLLLFVRVVPTELFTVMTVVLIVRAEVALFSVMPVTFEPTPPEINTSPEPVPELVIIPALLIDAVDRVMASAVELLLFNIKLPMPVTPLVTVSNWVPAVFVRVVPDLFTVMAVVPIVRADVVLFSVMPVTLGPTPPEMVVVPLPAPTLVIVPALLSVLVESVMVPVVPFSFIVKLLVPLTPPENVVDMPEPVLPIVSVPTVALVASTIGFAIVKPLVLTKSVAGLVPVVSPSVIAPVPVVPPKQLALAVP